MDNYIPPTCAMTTDRAQQFTKKGLSGTVRQKQTNAVMEEHDS